MDSYSLRDLVEVTGAKRRSLQLWADAGVILAERGTQRAGTGTHRQFSRREAIVACIIRPLAERQIAIGELLALSDRIRLAIVMSPDPFEAAIAGGGETIYAFESIKRDDIPGGWVHQSTIGPREIFARRTTSWPDIVLAIRLETYLARLR
ncbi:hypothetical protein M2222_001627 [Bradyrhizobium elkanii]|uniref:hypothetical protein n=1 Tax=Bradyrhizobium elkanii TaxID=29448 RepID=UPI002168A610|nr:hypothetical protein [Bradyrhizobium elkanii]MCS3449552.1 hypothetical protein [Bradyrhizobium elkanii]MCS3559305.1 hypothetical protein [Bradyrhizobium elkanii]MCW2150849.1 hypothetical protein [Bradyrhizobium elkanii]MCW2374580.1 hypothetical protein [Bradyrhizobium elkanii]